MKLPYIPEDMIERQPWRLKITGDLRRPYVLYSINIPNVEFEFKSLSSLLAHIEAEGISLTAGDIIVAGRKEQQEIDAKKAKEKEEELKRRYTPHH